MQPILGLLAVKFAMSKIYQDEMDIGAATDHVDPHGLHIGHGEPLGNDPRTGERQSLAGDELRRGRHLERNCLSGDYVLERTTLLPREHRRVQLFAQFFNSQDEPASWTTQRLVRG
ncbi:Uncharacterised protein [Mycobacteroides abscessus subsp. massiliense]|nr:Uncharacterised protein [Mycobacteroides abscessus subsp. massiliense]